MPQANILNPSPGRIQFPHPQKRKKKKNLNLIRHMSSLHVKNAQKKLLKKKKLQLHTSNTHITKAPKQNLTLLITESTKKCKDTMITVFPHSFQHNQNFSSKYPFLSGTPNNNNMISSISFLKYLIFLRPRFSRVPQSNF